MISCSSRSGFLARSGMLLRCVHLLRHILDAFPAAYPHSLRVLQLLSHFSVWCCCHMHYSKTTFSMLFSRL